MLKVLMIIYETIKWQFLLSRTYIKKLHNLLQGHKRRLNGETCFVLGGQDDVVKVSLLPKLIFKFNAILIKLQLDRMTLKFTWDNT